MDRSFLSHPAVVAASRAFVCVRLLSYENKEEMAFLKSFGAGKSGEAENTVFCMMAPDGKRLLTNATRGPRGSATQLAETMTRLAKDHPAKASAVQRPELPLVANVRLALNVAACDQQPLVVIQGGDDATRAKLIATLSTLAWSDEFVGKFVYVVADSRKELDAISGVAAESAVFVIDPDIFGVKGKVLHQIDATAPARKAPELLKTGLARFQRDERNFWQHVKQGQSLGVFWQTQTPVTDPMELRAREKGRKKTTPED
jgi:hypothetical protein